MLHLFLINFACSKEINFPVVGDYGGKEEYPYWTSSMEPVAQSMDELCSND